MMMRFRNGAHLALALVIVLLDNRLSAQVLIDIDWQDQEIETPLSSIPGWMPIPGSANGPVIAEDENEPGNKFLTTGPENNQPTRDAFLFTNPGFNSGTTLTFTVDMWDPFLNRASDSPVHTFPRMVLGIYEFVEESPTVSMPSYFGIEHNDSGSDPTTGEWVVAGENFSNRQFGLENGILQDTWYTVQSVWDLGAATKSMSVKPRDSAESFTPIFTDVPIGFLNSEQDLSALNALAMRMMRGTQVDNILVEYSGTLTPRNGGDYDGSGLVDAGDYPEWRNHLGVTGTAGSVTGDGTGDNLAGIPDGDVDQFDFEYWRQQFDTVPTAAGQLPGSSVPEPGGFWIIAATLVGSSLLVRRRSLSGGV